MAVSKKTGFQLAALVCVALAGAAVFLGTDLTLEDVLTFLRDYPAALILGFYVLPIVSFPITPLFLTLGVVFKDEPVLALGVMASGVVVHLLVSYYLANSWLRKWMEALLSKRNARLPDVPKDQEIFLTFVYVVVPGLPYAIKNIVWAMTSVPFAVYFWVSLPVYALVGGLFVILGESAMKENWEVLAVVVFLGVGLSLLKNKLKRRVDVTPAPPA